HAPFTSVGAPAWRPDGRELAVVGRGNYSEWGEYGSLAVWAADTHQWRSIDARKDRSVEDVRWIRNETILVRVDDRFSDSLVSLDPASGKTAAISLAPSVLGAFDVSHGGQMLFTAQTGAHQSRAFARSLWEARSPQLVEDPNPQLSGIVLGKQIRATWVGGAHEAHDGLYILPPGYSPGKRYPLLIDVYPEAARDRFHSGASGMELGQLQAAWGYVVFMASPRGSVSRLYDFSRGKQAVEVASGVRGKDIAVEDVLEGIRALVAEGLVDDQRVCTFGHSNGGYVANILATEAPGSARCIVVSAGYSDLAHAYFNEPTHAWSQGFAQADLLISPQTYVELSPIFRMGAVHSRMLLVDGDADWLPFLPQMIMQFNALRLAGKDVEFLRYPGEGHVFSRPEDIEDKLIRIQHFISENIGSGPE
ncbi:MAG: alpha/beta hydrolase family protein, partial [Terriglobales bacterium]